MAPFERAFRVRRQTLGEDHPNAVTSASNLALNLVEGVSYVINCYCGGLVRCPRWLLIGRLLRRGLGRGG